MRDATWYYDPPEDEPQWCPVCGCNADDCEQPEDEEQDNGDGVYFEVYTVEGHESKWVDLREVERDERADYEHEEGR